MKQISEADLAVSLGRNFGIKEALIIYTSKIDVKEYVFAKCKFGCTKYGTNWCCPPNTHTPEETRQLLKEYSRALLLFGESKGSENHNDFRKGMLEVEKAMMGRGYYKALALPIGPCTICERCAYLDQKNCVFPDQKRPSVEGMGIDIIGTVKRYKKNLDTTGKDKDQRFGLILLD